MGRQNRRSRTDKYGKNFSPAFQKENKGIISTGNKGWQIETTPTSQRIEATIQRRKQEERRAAQRRTEETARQAAEAAQSTQTKSMEFRARYKVCQTPGEQVESSMPLYGKLEEPTPGRNDDDGTR